MKLYTLVCDYWNAGDWYNYTVNNRSMNPRKMVCGNGLMIQIINGLLE